MRLRSLSRSGAGVDSKDSGQIFEAFFTTKPTGMGMGLAICRSIVAAHISGLRPGPQEARFLAARCGGDAHSRAEKYGPLCELAHKRLARWKQILGCRGLPARKVSRSDETGKSLGCCWSLHLWGWLDAGRISRRACERKRSPRFGMPGRYQTGIRQRQETRASADAVQHVCANGRNRTASLLVLQRMTLQSAP